MSEKITKVVGDISKENYTLIAKENLRIIKDDKKLQKIINSGDTEIFEEILLKSRKEKRTFGDYIKRIVFELFIEPKDKRKIDEIPEEEYIEDIQSIFAENDMKGIGTLQPGGTTKLTPNNLKKWMAVPSSETRRDRVFLFAFGFNLGEDDVEILLTDAIGQESFNFRNYKEAIYYWCLHKDLGYSGVQRLLRKYESEEFRPDSYIGENPYRSETRWYGESLKKIEEEKRFEQYLLEFKSKDLDPKKRETSRKILNEVLNKAYYEISPERRAIVKEWKEKRYGLDVWNKSQKQEADKLKKRIQSLKIGPFIAVLQEEIKKGSEGTENMELLSSLLPHMWKEKSLQEKMNGDIRIKREDILTGVFLTYAHQLEENLEKMCQEEKDYSIRVETFIDDVEGYLEQCGMGKYYMVNPYEMFLVLCLLHEKPYSFFMGIWKLKK